MAIKKKSLTFSLERTIKQIEESKKWIALVSLYKVKVFEVQKKDLREKLFLSTKKGFEKLLYWFEIKDVPAATRQQSGLTNILDVRRCSVMFQNNLEHK